MDLLGSRPSAIIVVAYFPKLLKEISTCCKDLLFVKQLAIALAHGNSSVSPSWLRL
jgi:hypothetical protein